MENRPIKKFRSGNIEAAIWSNTKDDNGQAIEFKTVSISRGWKQEDKWHNSQIHLRRNDIQKVILVLQKAQEDLFLNSLEE
ncbi:TPA: hypothetical protein H1005_02270 [archaeon]|nr:hypothetical protein [Candidatus Naiadarchaeales archaeon SRR2090153.bin1042]